MSEDLPVSTAGDYPELCTASVKKLAAKYGIKSFDGLTRLLGDIQRASDARLPEAEDPENSQYLAAQKQIKSHWTALHRHAQAILEIDQLGDNEGLALGTLRIRSPQRTFEVISALHLVADTPPRAKIVHPRPALIRALMFPLLHYALAEIRYGQFHLIYGTVLPDPGTSAQFVLDALEVAGWMIDPLDVARQYDEAHLILYAQLTSEEGEVPLNEDAESTKDTEPLGETGWLEDVLHSYHEPYVEQTILSISIDYLARYSRAIKRHLKTLRYSRIVQSSGRVGGAIRASSRWSPLFTSI